MVEMEAAFDELEPELRTQAAGQHATHRMVGSVAVSPARRSPVPLVIGHSLAVRQASARTVNPSHADRNTRVRSDHSNFFPNDPWYHLLAPEALSRCS
jgi:hypothetical protein